LPDTPRTPPTCAICRRPVPFGTPGAARLLPFCSRRCADVDLGRWMTGQYVVPGREGEEADEDTGLAADAIARASHAQGEQ
jgi:uncharacterized protein